MLNISIKNTLKTRVLIGEKGYSLRKFAIKIGVSQSYLSQVINRKRNPSPIVANKIAKGLDAKMQDIFFIQSDNKCDQKEVN